MERCYHGQRRYVAYRLRVRFSGHCLISFAQTHFYSDMISHHVIITLSSDKICSWCMIKSALWWSTGKLFSYPTPYTSLNTSWSANFSRWGGLRYTPASATAKWKQTSKKHLSYWNFQLCYPDFRSVTDLDKIVCCNLTVISLTFLLKL